ncbi:hypothetical protein DM02DRAFT_503132, partial [Periconia macrospinosa]
NHKKRYILMPNTQYAPDAFFKLGTLITDPFDPESTIEDYSIVPFPASMSTISTFQTQYEDVISNEKKGKYGVFTSFLSFVGIGLDLSTNHASGDEATNIFEKLETKYFTPRQDYAESILQDEHVKKCLHEPMMNPNVYMVTGIKIAIGVKGGTRKHSKQNGAEMSLEMDPTLSGTPISIGPHIEGSREVAFGTKFGQSTDYIYAYRVAEVHYSRR